MRRLPVMITSKELVKLSIEPLYNTVNLVDLTLEKGAALASVLMPASCRRQLVDLSDDMATKVDVQFYLDAGTRC